MVVDHLRAHNNGLDLREARVELLPLRHPRFTDFLGLLVRHRQIRARSLLPRPRPTSGSRKGAAYSLDGKRCMELWLSKRF
eukprot:SAG31_NODE_20_length_34168_cov_33.651296_20_plen_81_part_00